MADANSVTPALATLGGSGWTPSGDARYGGVLSNMWIGTWANRPLTGTIPIGQELLVTDLGLAPGMLVQWDGTRWIPCGPQVLARSSVAISGAANITENTLVTVTVPAGLLGINGSIRCRGALWSCTNNVNAKTIRARYNAANIIMQASLASSGFCMTDFVIGNRAANNSQLVYGLSNGAVNTAGATGTDTTAASTITLTAEKGLAGDTLTLEHYVIEVLP